MDVILVIFVIIVILIILYISPKTEHYDRPSYPHGTYGSAYNGSIIGYPPFFSMPVCPYDRYDSYEF